ncbi:jg5385 [Pararge aegeria aegeria]|uniref:Jg5385 protein n=2 Tax=Pararge aegeria TaxID=116150 RepID=A0A8S4RKS4_9NEOP|nr:jg5385 [Pararge aegeria aegeria]
MYIALKWLAGMVSAMWIGLCLVDLYLKDNAYVHLTKFNELNYLIPPLLKNTSILPKQKSIQETDKKNHPVHHNSLISQYITFIAGACLVIIYYRKNDLILYTSIKLKRLNKYDVKKHLRKYKILKNTATVEIIYVAILRILEISKGIFKKLRMYLLTINKKETTPKRDSQNVNIFLLKKLREYSQERRNWGHVIFAAIHENKNIRMRCQLEMLAKKRLVKHIEDTQKQIKENKSRYLTFQQLYLVTHQENNFLKSRVRKLTQDKEEAERNLIKLVNYVWQSKNNELKEYCTRFIVKTKDNLLNSDVRVEIDKFLTYTSKTTLSHQESNKSHYLSTIKEDNDNFREDMILVKDAPKLRGLPGESVWTVKDKDGLIEKLYEYETDFDSGDIIRRIRQYSVYYDKDCLLDVSSSTTLIQSTNIDLTNFCHQYINKRITGSQAFRNFLYTNKIISLPRTSAPVIY